MQTSVRWLMKMGAVYYCPVHPPAAECRLALSQEDSERINKAHREGVAVHGPNVCTQACPFFPVMDAEFVCASAMPCRSIVGQHRGNMEWLACSFSFCFLP